jgi:signal transduction histidine kinase
MISRLIDARRAAEPFRRRGAVATLAAIVIAGFAALATVGASDRWSDEARATRQAMTTAADTARAMLDRQQRGLDQLAAIAATSPDAPAQLFLDRVSSLAPGIRAAALFDSTGMLLLRSAAGVNASGLDEGALAALGAQAATEAAAQPGAAMLVTQAVRDGALAALARPWFDADGNIGGIVLVAIDRSAFPELDLVRTDGAPLFSDVAKPDSAGARTIALADFPLLLRYRPPPLTFQALHRAWPFVAIAVIGVTAVLSLLALLVARLHGAEREIVRQAGIERALRDELAAVAVAAGRTDELSRTKSQFFAQVTHELRTPLNAILGFTETIRQEMFGPIANSRYREYAGLINDAGSHLLSLINDLLDNARLEAGKMEISPIRISAAALARSALDLVELQAEGRDITLTDRGLATCPDLNVDPRAMKQVLVNLLSNAIKYTPPGGRIDVGFAARPDGSVAIEISDSGIGMSTEDLRVAFEPFGRAGAVEARRQQGTGLGLSLARALVRLHGGELTLASRLDSGTTATVTLPASAAFSSAAPRLALPAKQRGAEAA